MSLSTLRRIRTFTVREKPWRMNWKASLDGGKSLGQCFQQSAVVEVALKQPSRELLDTLIHELLHAEFPNEKERSITQAARDISAVLHRVGFRLKP